MNVNRLDVEKKAKAIRDEYRINYGVKDIFSILEQMDIKHIRYPFGENVLSGFATLFEGEKIIISNTSEILSREIFTIAHELGHIIYDFEDGEDKLKVDLKLEEVDDISEERAYYFANCFLLPEEKLRDYMKFELEKKADELEALDIVRIQIEFNVSYSEVVTRLFKLKIVDDKRKQYLFNERNKKTSKKLFKMLDENEKLIKATDMIKVPTQYIEWVTSNYNNEYVPYSSLEKALNLIQEDASSWKKEESEIEKEDIDIDDIFEEFE